MSGDETSIPDLLLGRYRIEGILGEGGLGSVVRAFDTRLRRTVAIKSLKRSLVTIEAAQLRAIEDRFSREAIAGSRMGSHPNLVAVYDLLIGPDETLYLVLEYVAGGTLAERLSIESPLPLADALQLTADIARGLQAAHDAGLVHRDIKPANIFLAADGRAQVGDFGIAQIDDVSGRTQTVMGHPGTPLYMSPEQSRMTSYLRPPSDQYSLGLVVFEMLTGKAYKRIGASEAARLLEDLPRPIAVLIERLVAENPEDRYPEMAAVSYAVQSIAAVMDLAPGANTPPYQPPARYVPRNTPLVNLQPAPPLETIESPTPTQVSPAQTPVPSGVPTPPPPQTPPPSYPAPSSYPTQLSAPVQPPPPARIGRRAALFAIGGVVLAGAAGGGFLLYEHQGGGTATATPQPSSGTTGTTVASEGGGTAPSTAAPATATLTVPPPTATPRPTSTPGPTSTPVLPVFSARVITDAMSHPEQWQRDNLPGHSTRSIENGIYTVRVMKKPDGSALFSWGDWVPAQGVRGPEFIAETEMRLQGDTMNAAGGFVFLFNYVSNAAEQQYLNFLLRADARFAVAQQLPGGAGHEHKFIDWAQHAAIKPGTDIVNLLRVEVRQGKFSCYVNNQPVYLDQPVPAEVISFSALSFGANVLRESVEPTATAIFTKFRYEKLGG